MPFPGHGARLCYTPLPRTARLAFCGAQACAIARSVNPLEKKKRKKKNKNIRNEAHQKYTI